MGSEPGVEDPVEQARRWLGHRAPPGSGRPGPPPPGRVPGEEAGAAHRPGPPATDGDGAGIDGDADPEAVALRTALRKLAAQARTRAELSRALQAKNVPSQAARTVLDRLAEVGLVDDAQFARDWVESRQRRRHLSRAALRRELTARGVAREEIDDALAAVEPQAEVETARELAGKKLKLLAGLDPVVRDRRLAGALNRRGFSPTVVATVLAEVRSSG